MTFVRKLCIGVFAAAAGMFYLNFGRLVMNGGIDTVPFSTAFGVIVFSLFLYLTLFQWKLVGPK